MSRDASSPPTSIVVAADTPLSPSLTASLSSILSTLSLCHFLSLFHHRLSLLCFIDDDGQICFPSLQRCRLFRDLLSLSPPSPSLSRSPFSLSPSSSAFSHPPQLFSLSCGRC
ncbi:unnamed protein product [Linum trigynum]|uniref:Uncharacterized protein n=1 Tax=Linum trigynum TaxID=586398 RepID=A0AAV2GBX8_9ROSI